MWLPQGTQRGTDVYRPAHFREDDPATIAAFIDAHALAVLVANSPAGLLANHIPLLRFEADGGGMVLRGHVARANDFWKVVPSGIEVLAVFKGADRYITPSWYPTKATSGEVVPTWNYTVVHAHGRIRFIDDAKWLRTLVGALTERHEGTRPAPWAVTDAPAPYIARMLGAIVGFEIAVERTEGKVKASQNRTEAEREGVSAGLVADGVPDALLHDLVRPRS